jgi:hypothetical protein
MSHAAARRESNLKVTPRQGLTEAESCELSKLAGSSLIEAEINLVGGGSVAPDAAKQYLDYVAKLRPYVADQVKSYC